MSDTSVEPVVRARLGPRPGDPGAAQLALLDHPMVPGAADVGGWVAEARRRRFRALRTSALFGPAARPFLDQGFEPVDRLTLLERSLRSVRTRRRRPATRRMRTRDLEAAARVDRQAFGLAWGNDAESLLDIRRATPHHRSRVIGDSTVDGFAISGRAGTTGYIQRLAVDPARQREGLGRVLVHDAIDWMIRHRVATALVNTGVDNDRALALYASEGFVVRPDELVVLELSLD
ncbi:MAG: GNAT family N-acetyltransferase [Ilumatobacteraceae bacterium]